MVVIMITRTIIIALVIITITIKEAGGAEKGKCQQRSWLRLPRHRLITQGK